MAVLIAIMVVAFLYWLQSKQVVGRRDVAAPIEPPAIAEPPFAGSPRTVAPIPTTAAPDAPIAARVGVPSSRTEVGYAFAGPLPAGRVDRTAAIVRLARGKGLCSPRQPPS